MTSTPQYLYGMHEPGGEHIFADRKGWIVFTEEIGHDPNNRNGKDFSQWDDQGYGIICRINNGYGTTGTIPLPEHFKDFAARCANYVAASKGCRRWIVGNEPNHPQEWPDNQKIDPWRYADCFNQVAAAIHALPGHQEDEVIAAPIAPWSDKAGDWIAYGAEMLKLLRGCGGIGLHAYTHGASPDTITSQHKMDAPYQDRYYEFWAYRQTLQLTVPENMRQLPVYLTEMAQLVVINNQMVGWLDANTGWAQAAYGDINAWNMMVDSQKIMCAAMYRWPDFDVWCIQKRQGVQNDLRAAVARGYEVPKLPNGNSVFIPVVGTGAPATIPPTNPLPPVEWDERLTKRGITLTQYQPKPGEWYWRITKGEYWEEKEHIFCVTLDENGVRKPDVGVRYWWADGKTDKKTELKPNDRWMSDFGMNNHSCSYGFKVLDGPSDSTFCMGLGSWQQPDWNIHVSYHFTVQWTQAPAASVPATPPPTTAKPLTQFKLGDTVYTGGYVNLRRTAGYANKPATDVVHTLEPNTRIRISLGPRTVDGLIWWGTADHYGGWIAENDPSGAVLLSTVVPDVVDDGVPVLVHPIGDEALRVLTQPFGVNEAFYKQFLYDGVALLGHNGNDYGIPVGTPIRTIDTGKVLEIKTEEKGFGLHMLVRHSWGDSLYAHLSQVNVAQGQEVSQGQVIALSGNTGLSSGPHLHFGLRLNGYNRKDGYGGYSDPSAYLTPTVNNSNVLKMSNDAAAEFNIDPDVYLNLLYAENRFRLSGTSPAGAVGPAQIMPSTFAEWAGRIGVKNINNPSDNIRVGAKYLSWLIQQFKGNIVKALYAYNWGIGNVQSGNIPPVETQIYAYSIVHGAEFQKALRKL